MRKNPTRRENTPPPPIFTSITGESQLRFVSEVIMRYLKELKHFGDLSMWGRMVLNGL
jgi:hypothetical protein